MKSLFPQLNAGLTPYLHCSRWVIAYSGGMDSHVLLHLLVNLHQQLLEPKPQLLVLHINHGLQAEADAWQLHCEQASKSLNTPFSSIRVNITTGTEIAGNGRRGNLEEHARNARYRAFERMLGEGDLLLMAHHLDDQLETLMQRMLRGSGIAGLAAMPKERSLGSATLLRPLLDIARKELVSYALDNKLCWVEDNSNRDESFDRNYLRHSVLPLIESRWPAYRTTLSRAIAHIAEADSLLKEMAIADLPQLQAQAYRWGGYCLSCRALNALSTARQRNVLRYWMSSCALPVPSSEHLAGVMAFAALSADSSPLLQFGGIEVRRYRDALVFMPCLADVDVLKTYALAAGATLSIKGLGDVFLLKSKKGERVKLGAELSVRFRQGGIRCQPAARAHSQTLKKLLHEYQVPPWMRDRIPLLYSGNALIAVANLWVCKGYIAKLDEPGYKLDCTYSSACFH